MDIDVIVDEIYTTPKLIIYTNQITEELSYIIDSIPNNNQKKLQAYKDGKIYILNQNEIETIYSESGKVYIRCNQELYTIKYRLYELETLLNKSMFVRISNSEIVNFNEVSNLDFKIVGTIILSFKSGNKAYASRRYIPKIKKFLEI